MSDSTVVTQLKQLARVLSEIAAEPAPEGPNPKHSRRVCESALLVVVEFLDGMQPFRGVGQGSGLTQPLWDLIFALQSIDEGIAHPMLVPPKTGLKVKSHEQSALMAWAAIALDCRVRAGEKLKFASESVAMGLQGVRLFHGTDPKRARVTGATVRNWRSALTAGQGASGVTESALFAWRKYKADSSVPNVATPQTLVAWADGSLKRLVAGRLILQSPPKKVED